MEKHERGSLSGEKVLYFDAFSGLSGDMIISSLISLCGIDEDWFRDNLGKLGLSGYEVYIVKDSIASISGISFRVEDTGGGDISRNLSDIEEIIKLSSLSGAVKSSALCIFGILADAEACIHGKLRDEVHFHEVGGVDAIIDIVGVSILFDYLGIDEVYSSALPFARGFVECAHGLLPLPAPASLEILKGYDIYGVDVDGELVTPTGAAIIKHFSKGATVYPSMLVEGIGYGIGSCRREKPPNVLRSVMGIRSSVIRKRDLILLETNIDDISPEIIPYVSERLFGAGALDVFTCPIVMKKGRSGIKLSVLLSSGTGDYSNIMSIIFKETTSIGVRKSYLEREELEQHNLVIDSPRFGQIAFKESIFRGEVAQVKPEFECLARIARDTGLPLKDLYKEFILEYKKDRINYPLK